ncbi:MAG: protein-methionine-sulfoxide reductase catalytic subunit MsrP, partial [Shewanella oncorhynchi]
MAKHSRFTPGILKKAQWHMQDNQVTPEAVFRSRRQIVKAMGLGAIGASVPGYVQAGLFDLFGDQPKSSFITTPLTFQSNKQYGDA